MPGDEDDWNPDTRVGQLVLKVQAIGSRKSYIENQATRPVRWLALQELLWRREGFGMQADRFQHAMNGRTHRRIVINDEHRGCVCGRHAYASMMVGRVK